MNKFTERYYQREARADIEKGLKECKSGILHLGTGAGKTSIVAKNIENIPDRCLFLGDQEELLNQPIEAFERVAGVASGREQAKERASLDARVVVASSQTMTKKARRERFPKNHFDRIYVDEAHRGSDRDKRICDYFETAKLIGLTATPFRSNLKNLNKYFERVFYSKPMLDLCAEGFAPPMEIFTLPVEVDLQDCALSKIGKDSDYKMEDVDSTITPELEAIAALYAEHAKLRHTLAYLPLIKTSEAFAAALRNVGINAEHIDGQSPNRDSLQKAFANGQIDVLCNAGVMSTGIDLPIADCFLNLRPTHSMNEYQQSAGRTMRVLPDLIDHLPEKDQADERKDWIEWSQKPNSLMFDLLWQNGRLGVMSPAHLVANNWEEAAMMTAASRKNLSPEDLLALQRRVQAEREAKIIRDLERAALKATNGRPTKADHVAMLIGDRKLLAYEPVMKWEKEPPSDAQIALLTKWKIDTTSLTSKGQASAIQNAMVFRFKNDFATLNMVKAIMRINERRDPEARVPNPHLLSFAEASAILNTESAQRHARRLRPPEDDR